MKEVIAVNAISMQKCFLTFTHLQFSPSQHRRKSARTFSMKSKYLKVLNINNDIKINFTLKRADGATAA